MSKRLAQALADKLENIVQALTDSQLQQALKDCNWCSETNCGWVEYHLSPTVHEVVDSEIDRRLTENRDGNGESGGKGCNTADTATNAAQN